MVKMQCKVWYSASVLRRALVLRQLDHGRPKAQAATHLETTKSTVRTIVQVTRTIDWILRCTRGRDPTNRLRWTLLKAKASSPGCTSLRLEGGIVGAWIDRLPSSKTVTGAHCEPEAGRHFTKATANWSSARFADYPGGDHCRLTLGRYHPLGDGQPDFTSIQGSVNKLMLRGPDLWGMLARSV